MPEMLTSHSAQRFAALLEFHRDVDLMNPSHLGETNCTGMEPGFIALDKDLASGQHHSLKHNWSGSLSSFLSSTFRASKLDAVAPSPPTLCAVQAAVTRSQGQFSPQAFLRNGLKRALTFSREESSTILMKRARTQFGNIGASGYSTQTMAPPMVVCR